MGVGPLIAWRRTSPQTLMRTFLAPVTMGVGAGVVVFAMGLRQWYVLTALSLAAFALGTVIVEFRRGVSARRHLAHETPVRALANLVGKNNRRYGGYIIHLGVVFAFVGIVASSFFRTEVKRSVRQGESFSVGAYDITVPRPQGRRGRASRGLARAPRREQRWPRDCHDVSRPALLQTPAAARYARRDTFDPAGGSLRRAGRRRRPERAGHVRGISHAARILAMGGRLDDGDLVR